MFQTPRPAGDLASLHHCELLIVSKRIHARMLVHGQPRQAMRIWVRGNRCKATSPASPRLHRASWSRRRISQVWLNGMCRCTTSHMRFLFTASVVCSVGTRRGREHMALASAVAVTDTVAEPRQSVAVSASGDDQKPQPSCERDGCQKIASGTHGYSSLQNMVLRFSTPYISTQGREHCETVSAKWQNSVQ